MYFIGMGVGDPSDLVAFLLLGIRNFISVAPDVLPPYEMTLTDFERTVTITDLARTVEFADSITEVQIP